MTNTMIELFYSQKLRDLGFEQILQIHDEVILEGPRENADEAERIIRDIAENSYPVDLLVDLKVESRIADTWG